jgi:hypothetical protein
MKEALGLKEDRYTMALCKDIWHFYILIVVPGV